MHGWDLDYNTYIQSQRWRERRKAFFKNHPYRCEGCGRRKGVELHHLSYERLGSELDEDLVPLCSRRGCHPAAHREYDCGNYATLALATKAVITKAQRRSARRRAFARVVSALVGRHRAGSQKGGRAS
jgi:hypothetical protein